MAGRKSAQDLDEFRHHNLAWLLLYVRQDFFRRMSREWDALGYRASLQNAHGTVLTHLPLEGARLTDLANAAGVSKQAMGQLVDDVERLGYVERVADLDDRRAKRVRFTDAGFSLLSDARKVVGSVWAQYEELIGRQRMTSLRSNMDRLASAIEQDRNTE